MAQGYNSFAGAALQISSPNDWRLAVAHGRRTNAAAGKSRKAGAGGKRVRAAKWGADRSEWPDARLTGCHRLGEHQAGTQAYCDFPGCKVQHASFSPALQEKKAAEKAGRWRCKGRGRGELPVVLTAMAHELPPELLERVALRRRRRGQRGGEGDSRQLDSSRA